MLYKYLPPERVDVLENLSIRFSPMQSLNDPFESRPLIELREEKSYCISEVNTGLDSLWEEQDEKTKEKRKELEEARNKLINNANNLFHPNSVGKQVFSNLGDNLGVLSLSRTKTNLLMWSHYTNEGKGYVLSLDDKHDFFKQKDRNGKITHPIPVVYTSTRRVISALENNYYQRMLCEKPLEWSYEEEERIFRTFLSKVSSIGKDDYGQDIILSDLPPETINGVYIGYRASIITIGSILHAVKKNKLKCPIFYSTISDKEYRIQFMESKKT